MARQKILAQSECPVARTLEAIGDRWVLMIIRDAFDDVRRFSEFQKRLGLAKNILTVKLKRLVELGVFDVQPASDGSAYKEYVLTEMGRAVFPIVISLRQWGEQFLFSKGESYSILLDNELSEPVDTITVRSKAGKVLAPMDCHRRVIKRDD
ncbi:winged helix-turn-helix transcriptional regulator [Pseudomonas fluorescens]|uniref:Helix-turn-helix transcriptional regulator n=1 Tax=Pseudomonas fluorescens TaxID=294 RepID=A0A944DKN1_PSEFL|nr:helix-turn-helix domain-containing protein [Pseudomonas fluorescens]MBT2297363.1 helix-turn-helix transcriptional regulator [Pseudomonas fluorescens]MBT2305561.1 helix-turn-helix transcriptional regulator [Pseudomonas fluorescens]MBT2314416.1 helix-turn-helix transcriptional regulator [Pseudomonas fluorescens]MBT2319092.1 helix-turn-helix transcriptional regulator [Pseudomonas fluorescens]MBT2328635.1 helix-turn-helix transcriptional regulator [Pseudomonas fluorescens]